MNSKFRNLSLAIAAAAVLLCGIRADATSRPAVMISIEPMTQGSDVVLTYSVPVSQADILSDIRSIHQNTGWVIDQQQITSIPGRGSAGALFSAELLTSPAIQPETGRLPVAPLVLALRHYRDLMLVFDVPQPFTYTGNRAYQDQSVGISMLPQAPGSCTYAFQVLIKDPSFTELNPPEMDGRAAHPLTIAKITMALLAALLVGGVAYLVLLRLMTRGEATAASGS